MSKKDAYPPAFSLKLIRWLCHEELSEEIEGNLIEFYQQNINAGVRFNAIRYWFQVLNYLRPSTLKRFKASNKSAMFNFNPLFTIRNIFKQGSSAVINILGFSLGLVCVLFLYFHLKSELSYDEFHKDKDHIYRTVRVNGSETDPEWVGVTSGPYAPALINDFPSSIQTVCRVQPSDILVTFEDQQFLEEKIILADSNFFSFFSCPLMAGTPDQVLNGLNEAVLSQETAQKYFGDNDPIGKIIRLDNQGDFLISGVMGDLSAKTHMGDFSMVLNINNFNLNGWWNNGLVTYVKIESPEEAAYVDSRLDDFMVKYLGDDFESFGVKIGLTLEPLGDIYFNNKTRFDWALHGNINTIYMLGLVGLAILLIACFNYVNLSIAQSFKRAKEIAVRKILGGQKNRLILQFLGESFTILIFATAIAVGLSFLLNSAFNNYFDLDVHFDWLDPNLISFGCLLMLGTLIFAGLYPAILLSSFDPLKVMKGGKVNSGKNVLTRKSLVVIQFLIAIFMIAVTLLISEQMNYVQSKDLGFDREAVMMVDINNGNMRQQVETFKESFEDDPNILSVTAVGGEPGGFHDATTVDVTGVEGNHKLRIGWGDGDYFETFGIKIAHGRSFGENLESDLAQTAVINKYAMKALGLNFDNVLERRVNIPSWNLNLRIIGVSEDYNFTSLKEQLEPLIIVHGLRYRRIGIKMNAENLSDAIATVNNSWSELSPDYPITYDFLDDSIDRLYEHEAKQSRVFSVFAAISIFLACMGVFGLATYAARQRQKELGIRKVLGASAQQIIGLLSKEFVILILIASLIAVPASWYFIDQWLNNFAYQISIQNNWLLFVSSGLAVGVIVFFTVGLKTYRAAVSNPTESIRYE